MSGLHRPYRPTALLLAALVGGCGLFEPRDPEPPITPGSTYESPTTPSLVLSNLERAVSTSNIRDYRRCFGDTARGLGFSFVPATDGYSAAPQQFDTWKISDEESWFRSAVSALQGGTAPSLTLNPSEVTSTPVGDSVQHTARYELRIPHNRAGVETEARGTLQFTLRRDNQGEWAVTRWRDLNETGAASWSLIKARFVGR